MPHTQHMKRFLASSGDSGVAAFHSSSSHPLLYRPNCHHVLCFITSLSLLLLSFYPLDYGVGAFLLVDNHQFKEGRRELRHPCSIPISIKVLQSHEISFLLVS